MTPNERIQEIKRVIADSGLTQHQVAQRAGMAGSNLSAILKGKRVLTEEMEVRILKAAGRTPLRPRDVLAARHEDIVRIARDRGFGKVSVFGSTARGEDTIHSDLDLLATIETARGFKVFGLAPALTDELGVHVDVMIDDELVPDFVRAEAVAL